MTARKPRSRKPPSLDLKALIAELHRLCDHIAAHRAQLEAERKETDR
jgi:hypothetical protein